MWWHLPFKLHRERCLKENANLGIPNSKPLEKKKNVYPSKAGSSNCFEQDKSAASATLSGESPLIKLKP